MGDQPQDPKMKVKLLQCRRTGQTFDPKTHAECPYCCADAKTVEEGGKYEDFCTWKKGEDPINFGFDPDSSRFTHG